MKTATIIIMIALALSACGLMDPPEDDSGKRIGALDRIEVDGVECIVLNRKAGYAGMGGLSCNWEAYNR